MASSSGAPSVEDFLAASPGSYEIRVQGHRVLVQPTAGGVGYCPVDLIAEGKLAEAARIAGLAFSQGGDRNIPTVPSLNENRGWGSY